MIKRSECICRLFATVYESLDRAAHPTKAARWKTPAIVKTPVTKQRLPIFTHGNSASCVVHGGALATAFDVALGNASWDAASQKPCATVQLNIHYVGALQLGEFAEIAVELIKATRSLVFLRGTMRVDSRIIATADGVWKILEWRGAPFVP